MKNKSKIQLAVHAGFIIIVLLVIGIIGAKVVNFVNGEVISDEEFHYVAEDVEETENMDYILPLIVSKDTPLPNADGEQNIVCFGNAPFADDRDSEDNLCNMIAELTGANVYNCSYPGSGLTHYGYPEYCFTFYWIATAACIDNYKIYDTFFKENPDCDPSLKGIVEYMKTIDFNTIDTIVLMYDGTDYLKGHRVYNIADLTDTWNFTGSMAAGIQLFQETYPHIRFIVASPTYAFAEDENGNYVSSDTVMYLPEGAYLSTYVVKQADIAYELSVSFIDNLYGTIHEDIAPDYLTDNIHLNLEGRKKVAKRIADAVNKYPDPVVQ